MVDTSRLDKEKVGLLSRVDMLNLGNQAKMTYTIVSPHEANMREGKISIKTPIAQDLHGKRVGDEVGVNVPAGAIRLKIEGLA